MGNPRHAGRWRHRPLQEQEAVLLHRRVYNGTLALKMEAREWDQSIENFSPFQAPVGPEGNAEHHSNFHAPEGHHRIKGMASVMGVWG